MEHCPRKHRFLIASNNAKITYRHVLGILDCLEFAWQISTHFCIAFARSISEMNNGIQIEDDQDSQ